MMEVSARFPGNPASLHSLGRAAARRFEDLKVRFLELLGLSTGDWKVVFTSGGTEADALALVGTIVRRGGGNLVTDVLEHAAVLGCRPLLERMGGTVTVVPAQRSGRVSPERMAEAVGPDTVLLSVMHTNNEIGTIQDLSRIARLAKEKKNDLWVHSDAVQALGHADMAEIAAAVDLMSVSAHKIGGPRGCGALLYRRETEPSSLTGGGGQQEGLRSGTVDLPAVAGFVRALELERTGSKTSLVESRDLLWESVRARIDSVRRNGTGPFAPHILSLLVPGIGSEVLVRALSDRGVCVSAGSACRSGGKGLSGTMKSLAPPAGWGILRFSLCRHTTADQVVRAADLLSEVVEEFSI